MHGNKHYIVEENGVLCHDNLIKIFCVYGIMRRNCNGIYSVLEQIRKRLSEETTYTEGVSEVPEGEDPSFEANQVASGYSLPWDSGDRKNPGL